MSNCINCTEPITKNNKTGICYSCKTNKNITITFTLARTKFKLTESEIKNAGLFTIHTKVRGNSGRKYLIKDIESLAKKIINSLDPNDKRRTKMEKKLGTIEPANIPKQKAIIPPTITNKPERGKTIMKYIDEKYPEYKNKLLFTDLVIKYINNIITYESATTAMEEKYQNHLKKCNFEKLLLNYVTKSFSKDELIKKIKTYHNLGLKKSVVLTEKLISDYFIYDKNGNLYNYISSQPEYVNFSQNEYHFNFNEVDIDGVGFINKLSTKVEIYIYQNVTKQNRIILLTEKLHAKGLLLRSDSKLCNWYIEGDIVLVNKNIEDQPITSADDIVETMDEMNFYHTKTNYAAINKTLIGDNSKRVYDSDNSDDDDSYDEWDEYKYHGRRSYHWTTTKPISKINLEAKISVLKRRDNSDYNSMPINVKNLCDKYCNFSQKVENKRK